MHNELSQQAIRLLISNFLFRSWNSIRRIFLNIYIFKFIWDLQILALFSILMLGFHFIWFLVSSYVVKQGYRNILTTISLFWMSSTFILLALDTSIIQSYYIILSAAMWFFSGTYWCVYNNNQFDFTVPKNRWNYEGWKKTLRTLNALVTPVIIWAVIAQDISWNWYALAFFLGGIMFLLSAGLSYIDESKLKKQDTTFRLYEVSQLVGKRSNMLSIMIVILLTGYALSTNVIEVITPLVFTENGINELWVGIFISIVSLISMLTSYIFGRYVDYKYYKKSFVFAGGIYLLLVTLLLILPTEFHFSIFVSSLAILYIFMDIPVTVFASNYLHEIPNYQNFRSEYILIREFSTIIWRMLMFVPMLFLGSFSLDSLFFIFFTMATSILISIILFLSLRIPNK